MDHGHLIEQAKAAIDAVFGDQSVSREETIEALEELIEHCQVGIDAIETDLERADEEDE